MENIIDCMGLKCPMPILKTRLSLNKLKKDDLVLILSDDPGFINDISTFCFQADLELIESKSNQFLVKLKK